MQGASRQSTLQSDKVNVISRLFGRSAAATVPWTEQSIYRFISSHIDPQSGELDSKDLELPDEPPRSGSKLRWAPGALDGVMVEIIRSMIAADHGAGAGLDRYPDAGAVCIAHLNHLQSAEPDLLNLLASRAILDYVTEDERSDAERLKCGWTESTRDAVRACAAQVIERAEWRALIRHAATSAVTVGVEANVRKHANGRVRADEARLSADRCDLRIRDEPRGASRR